MSKRRRTLKRAGVGVCVVILGAWIGSTIWAVGWTRGTLTFAVESGTFITVKFRDEATRAKLQAETGTIQQGWSSVRMPTLDVFSIDSGGLASYFGLRFPQVRDTPSDVSPNAAVRCVFIPLWLPFLIVALPTTFMFYRDRKRIPPGHCSTCGYNLTGAEHERCPECGAFCGADGSGTL